MKSPSCDRVPMVAQAVNPRAFEHQKAVLHHVNLHHGQRRARLERHGVDGEIERRDRRGSGCALPDPGRPSSAVGATALSLPLKQAGIDVPAAAGKAFRLPLLAPWIRPRNSTSDAGTRHNRPPTSRAAFALQHIDEPLVARRSRCCPRLRTPRVLGEPCARCRRRVHDRSGALHPRQGRAHERVRRL